MSDPARLLHGDVSSFEKAMIRSGQTDAPSHEARIRAMAALGLGAALGASAASVGAGVAPAAGAMTSAAAGAASAPMGAGACAGAGAASAAASLSAAAAVMQGSGAGAGVAGVASTVAATAGAMSAGGAGATAAAAAHAGLAIGVGKWAGMGILAGALAVGGAAKFASTPLSPSRPTCRAELTASGAATSETSNVTPPRAPLLNRADRSIAPAPGVAADFDEPHGDPAPQAQGEIREKAATTPQQSRRTPLSVPWPASERSADPREHRPRPVGLNAALAVSGGAGAASGSSAAAVSASPLASELAELDRARSEIAAGTPNRALSILDTYEQTHQLGNLRDEAVVLRIEALLAMGRYHESAALSETFLSQHPRSPYATRVVSLLDRAQASDRELAPSRAP